MKKVYVIAVLLFSGVISFAQKVRVVDVSTIPVDSLERFKELIIQSMMKKLSNATEIERKHWRDSMTVFPVRHAVIVQEKKAKGDTLQSYVVKLETPEALVFAYGSRKGKNPVGIYRFKDSTVGMFKPVRFAEYNFIYDFTIGKDKLQFVYLLESEIYYNNKGIGYSKENLFEPIFIYSKDKAAHLPFMLEHLYGGFDNYSRLYQLDLKRQKITDKKLKNFHLEDGTWDGSPGKPDPTLKRRID